MAWRLRVLLLGLLHKSPLGGCLGARPADPGMGRGFGCCALTFGLALGAVSVSLPCDDARDAVWRHALRGMFACAG